MLLVQREIQVAEGKQGGIGPLCVASGWSVSESSWFPPRKKKKNDLPLASLQPMGVVGTASAMKLWLFDRPHPALRHVKAKATSGFCEMVPPGSVQGKLDPLGES